MPKHPNEVERFPSQLPMEKAFADVVLVNQHLKPRGEPLDLSREEGPWPCVWPGCMEPCVGDACLCAQHEMYHIARTGKRSPQANTVIEWNNHLLTRLEWMAHWDKE